MIRIVGVQRSSVPEKEFILLQNQGPRRIPLEGYLLTDELGLYARDAGLRGDRMFTFQTDAKLIPSAYVALVTGLGEDGWRKMDDGSVVYYCYWNRDDPVWFGHEDPVHLLCVTNTHSPRRDAYVIRR
jgi:hypothetical protein